MTHTLRISHAGTHNSSASADGDGNYPVRMIRKQLSDSEISPTNIRYNTTTHKIQITIDGGTTWVNYPDDPRSNPIYRLPPRAGSSPQCNAAANMTAHVSDYVTTALLTAGAVEAIAATVLDFGLIIFPVTGVVGLLVDLIAVTVSNLVALGTTAIAAAMTSGVYDQLTEIIYCRSSSDGQVSASQLADIEAKVSASISTTAALIINSILEMWGSVGLSNVGTQGTAAGSCGSYACEWCYEFSFATEDHHAFWSADASYGHWVSSGYLGHGAWFGNTGGLILRCNFASTEVTYCEYDVAWTGTPDELAFLWRSGGSTLHTTLVTPVSSPQTAIDTRTLTINQMCLNPYGASLPALAIGRVLFKGHGTNPFGSDNC